MSNHCAICNQHHDTIEHHPTTYFVEPGDASLLCPRCAGIGAPPQSLRMCPGCHDLLRARTLREAGDDPRGYRLYFREECRAVGLCDLRPVPRAAPGDTVRLAVLNVDPKAAPQVELMWLSDVEERGDDGLVGRLKHPTMAFAPEALKQGDLVELQRAHVIGVIRRDALPERTDGHVCRLCDEGGGLERDPPNTDTASAQVLHQVRTRGMVVRTVFGDETEAGFAYTAGVFHSFGLPELIVTGLPTDPLVDLSPVVMKYRASGAYPLGVPIEGLFEDATAMFVELNDARVLDEYMTLTGWFQQGGFPHVQLVWSDRRGRFPWEPDCDPVVTRVQRLFAPASAPEGA